MMLLICYVTAGLLALMQAWYYHRFEFPRQRALGCGCRQPKEHRQIYEYETLTIHHVRNDARHSIRLTELQ